MGKKSVFGAESSACRDEEQRQRLDFISSQGIKAKFFSNGRQDSDIVNGLLRTFDRKRAALQCIQRGDDAQLRDIFENFPSFTAIYSQADLANEITDRVFNTFLHHAAKGKSIPVVHTLLEFGACATRNYKGDLPWEVFGIPWSSPAAVA